MYFKYGCFGDAVDEGIVLTRAVLLHDLDAIDRDD